MNRQYLKTTQTTKDFDEFRKFQYEEMSSNKGTMFNFFFTNNDVFQQITDEDMNRINASYANYMNKMSTIVLTTYSAIIVTNNLLMRNIPKYPRFRTSIFTFKYILLPIAAYKLGQLRFGSRHDNTVREINDKYHFGYSEYNRAIDIFERAYKVGRLEELVEQGQSFDWKDIPEIKSRYFID